MIDLTVLKENPELAKNVRFEINGADLLTFGESIHKQLWSWDRKGITKPLRIGNQKRYRKSDVEKTLQEQ